MCAKPLALDENPFVQGDALPLFQRETRERLSPTALQLLLDLAEVLVEGGTASGRSAQGAYLGSAMLTLDLAAVGDRLRQPDAVATAARLCAHLDEDADARRMIVGRALEAARARLAAPPGLRAGELRLRSEGARVLIDLDLETPQGRR